MLMHLIGFEIRWCAKQWVFRISLVVFLLLGVVLSVAPFGAGGHINAPIGIAMGLALLSLNGLFSVTLLAAQGALRDRDTRMEPLIFATPVSRFDYLVSRFVGLVACSLLAILPAAVGLVVGHLWLSDRSLMGPVIVSPYLWAVWVLMIPNIFMCCSVLFASAIATRNALTTYIIGVALYIAYWAASMMADSPLMAQSSPYAPSDTHPAILFEPFGIIGILDAVRFWTVEQKDQWLIPMTTPLLLNRLLWMGLSLSLLHSPIEGSASVMWKEQNAVDSSKTTLGTVQEAWHGRRLPGRLWAYGAIFGRF